MTTKTTHTLANTNGDVYLLADGRGNHIAALHAVDHFTAQAAATRKLIERGEYNPNGAWTQPRQGCSRYRTETAAK